MANKIVKVTIRLKDEFSRGLGKISSGLKRFASGSTSLISKVTKSFFSLKGAIASVTGVGGIGLLIKKSIQAASSTNQLKIRLGAVIESAEEAEKRFKEIKELGKLTPFDTEELIKAEILLRAVGKASDENLRQVGEAAFAMNRSIVDVAKSVGSLEAETLKPFGIFLKTVGDEFTFNFRDKGGEAFEVITEGADEAREALTDIFGQKFGGTLEKASASIAGKWEAFNESVQEAFGTIGERLLPTASRVLTQATEALNSLVGSGRLEEFGDRIARAAEGLVKWLLDVKPTFASVTSKLKDAAFFIGETIGDVAGSAFLRRVKGEAEQLVINTGFGGTSGMSPNLFKVPTAKGGPFTSLDPSAGGNITTGAPFLPPGSIAANNAASAASRVGSTLNNPQKVFVVNQVEGGFQ